VLPHAMMTIVEITVCCGETHNIGNQEMVLVKY
jgi:hypothetical protein